jgi:predicted ferric reductase
VTSASTGARALPWTAPRLQVGSRPLTWMIISGGVLSVGAWVLNTPRTLNGLGDWLTNAGRLTGLLAGYLLAVALLLMARIPALDRGVGSDRLARWHAFLGRYSLSLLAAHTVLIIWGYAVTAHSGLVAETGTLWSSYPDVLMATVAFGLLLMVGVLSARAARRRLAYETWFYLHLYTYLALALSFAHTFADGAEFVANPLNRVLWAGLYLSAVGAVLWWRLVTPVLTNLRTAPHVREVRREAPGVVSVYVQGTDFSRLGARSGQYFRLRFLTRDGWWHSHPYSLSTAPRQKYLRFTVKALGDGSGGVGRLRPGTRVWLSGPYGAISPDKQRSRAVLLLAGGIGITPLRALAESLPAGRDGTVTLLHRVDRSSDLVFARELEDLARKRGIDVRSLVGPPGSDADVLVGDRLTRSVTGLRDRDVFLCGPPGFVTAATRALRRQHVPASRIHAEYFALED